MDNLELKRFVTFAGYQEHPVLSKPWKRLTDDELEFVGDFIHKLGQADKGQFELAVNRMFIDKPKPKHWAIIMELLSCANSAL